MSALDAINNEEIKKQELILLLQSSTLVESNGRKQKIQQMKAECKLLPCIQEVSNKSRIDCNQIEKIDKLNL